MAPYSVSVPIAPVPNSRPSRVLRALPTPGQDEQDEARRRLQILADMTLAAFALVGLAALSLLLAGLGDRVVLWPLCILGLAVAVLALLLRWLLRRPRSASQVRRLAMIASIGVAMAMALTEVQVAPTTGLPRWGVSGIGIWIVLVPLVFPFPPPAALGVALASAACAPLAWLVGLALGLPPQDPAQLLEWWAPLAFCAGLATAAAWSVHRWRSQLDAARRELRDLGSWALVRALGKGGMGEVWEARHRLLPRTAAVKFIAPPDVTGKHDRTALARRFEAEAAAIARLDSQHTVTLFDYGVSAQGEWYYVMELLDGIDLQRAVQRHGPLPAWRVVRILAQICRSLSEAHGQGLVHRDLKPGNVMLCRQGGEFDVAKVLDFGLVAARGEIAPAMIPGASSPPRDRATRASEVLGTPGYIAPELLTGDPPPEPRHDLYSLGCTAWWLLTGHEVFVAADFKEELAKHIADPPPLARLVSIGDADLITLVADLLAKTPAGRPANAEAVRRRLERCASWHQHDEAEILRWWEEAMADPAGRKLDGQAP